ncbi:MAG: M61 family metallopeptidase [Balneola sp.]|nr:M61 family metallopeptidase [Balneola sp.]MBO6649612.1 M61 family metallopeptidase [Balneola sp.]MBO6711429.1 M61 family metallopeptidase [Balneola sp.]MBO6801217.1 M61 family metallopeptidase [Balneola sp.]MBO6869365.1 M61 family metallopeptidase [Balneola sp.]
MKKVLALHYSIFLVGYLIFATNVASAQTHNQYEISFENAVHHEAEISVTFPNVEKKVLEVRMSRTSPGRYALHEFAKNVYNVTAVDGNGNELEITRPNPHQWNVSGHHGTVKFSYTLYANRGGGTYTGIDETHAHMNMPATFAWARNYEYRPIEITFNKRDDLNWEIATQLKHVEGNTYYAEDLQYFLDSPTEIADMHFREEKVDGQNIRLALHTPASDKEVDEYFGKVMAIVKAQRDIYGELLKFDYDEYTFLSCYMPNASGDGMEHRNSTYVVSSKPLDRPLGETSIGTISHEFFHAWNVERIRPASLEPFDFEEANMSGELWFAEGFTSYYTGLTLARADIRTDKQYVEGLDGGLNYVINSPGRNYFNPIEMSYQAPFVDAARSVDPVNRSNTFVSYYTYGSVLGLGLDLSLRTLDKGLNLDDFMKSVWMKYGKTEVPYTVKDLQVALAEYAGKEFADNYFENYIFDSKLPDYESLFAEVGVKLELAEPNKASLGETIRKRNDEWKMTSNATVGSPIYKAGIESEDVFISISGTDLNSVQNVDEILANHKPGDVIKVVIERWGQEKTFDVTLEASKTLQTTIDENAGRKEVERRNAWLGLKK